MYKPWKENDRLWEKRSWTTKETLENECFIVYQKTTSSKVCTVTYPELLKFVKQL